MLGSHSGHSFVGKTCILARKIRNEFVSKPTIGYEYSCIKQNIKGKEYSVDLWDTAGQEKHRAIVPMFFK